MENQDIQQVRRFNRMVTQRVGALEQSYLHRGRPLGEARLLFEVGVEGADVRALRARLGLDSGYLSRLLRALEGQGLLEVTRQEGDARVRRAILTPRGREEFAAYDDLSDALALSMLAPLDPEQRTRLTSAMAEVERLIRAAGVRVAAEDPDSADARWCMESYFRELAERFEEGFDAHLTTSATGTEMRPPSGLFILARLDGAPVGCAGLKRESEGRAEIKRMWTAPSARGLGVARRVLRALEDGARDLGFIRVCLDSNRALKEAHALYRKAGYVETAPFNANPYAHFWFEKAL